MVGALRRLATDAVVMNASVSHVMWVGFATTAGVAGTATGRPAGTSIEAIVTLRRSIARSSVGGARRFAAAERCVHGVRHTAAGYLHPEVRGCRRLRCRESPGVGLGEVDERCLHPAAHV